MKQSDFLQTVLVFSDDNFREMPWRVPDASGIFDPYKILVSEIMLQQTQVVRVIPKYKEFLRTFPDIETLARASLGDVLKLWQGLGYNRRAKFLWQAAQKVARDFDGEFPKDQQTLTELQGVGWNTAGAVCAYAYNQPVVFIETNIRTVFIHHFFEDRDDVHDKELVPLVQESLVAAQKEGLSPREWYWILMDYGVHLKATIGNVSRNSKHYAKQSAFSGSKRQLRGQVIRKLVSAKSVPLDVLQKKHQDPRIDSVISDLLSEGLICVEKGIVCLA